MRMSKTRLHFPRKPMHNAFAMSEDQFLKLFKYIEKRFDAVDKKFDSNDTRFDQVMSALDSILKQNETTEQERLITNHQLDRHEQWIEKAATQLRVKYDSAS